MENTIQAGDVSGENEVTVLLTPCKHCRGQGCNITSDLKDGDVLISDLLEFGQVKRLFNSYGYDAVPYAVGVPDTTWWKIKRLENK